MDWSQLLDSIDKEENVYKKYWLKFLCLSYYKYLKLKMWLWDKNFNKLLPGDEIIVYYQQQKYTYRVVKSEIVSPKNISYLSSQPGKNQLTLMTCWPPGTTISRLLVVADKIK